MITYICIIFIHCILIFEVLCHCSFEGKYNEIITCIHTNIQEVKSFEPHNIIETVNIVNSRIGELEANFLPFNLSKYLSLHCQIRKLNKASFKNLPNLIELDLSNNEISVIPLDMFENLQLKKLNFSNNRLGNPHLHTFHGLKHLENLDLSYNRIKFLIVGSLDEMVNLKYLNLSTNALFAIELSTFDQNTNMLTLDLSYNLLKQMLLGTFDEMKKLISLNIAGNTYSNIPLGVFDEVSTLTYVDMSNNKFRDFPLGTFDSLVLVDYIKLSNNSMADKTLLLGVFDEIKKVTKIDLVYCNIDRLPLGIFDEIKNLKFLNLSHNSINSINPYILDQQELDVLDLSYNKLTTFPENLMSKVLKELYLQHNLISSFYFIQSNTYYQMKFIDVGRNDLAFLPKNFFDSFIFLQTFEIGGNPWECSCLRELILNLNNRFIVYNKSKYFSGRSPSCIIGTTPVCEFEVTYKSADKLDFMSYF